MLEAALHAASPEERHEQKDKIEEILAERSEVFDKFQAIDKFQAMMKQASVRLAICEERSEANYT